MQSRRFKPVEPGRAASAPQHRGGTPKKEERRQAGTPATLEGNIDNAIDGPDDTGNRAGPQAYPVRWLVSRYPVSPAVAEVIANELGMEGD